ncbi:hypothetical protein BaRGS_00011177, partial [Batillaria attramentaria]
SAYSKLCGQVPWISPDARILRESSVWRNFEMQPPLLDGFILGDSAYPLLNWLLTPFLNSQTVAERRYNRAFTSARSTIERCFGVVKRRFHCLRTALRYSPVRACRIITACLVLQNLAVEFRTPEPPDSEDEEEDPGDNNCNLPPTPAGRARRQQLVFTYFGGRRQ